MHPVLSRNLFLVKEHVGFFKASSNYDIFDPGTGEQLMICREPNLGALVKLLRFTDLKRNTPFDVHVTTPDGAPVVRVHRGPSILRSLVKVHDEHDRHVGGFTRKLLSIGGAFDVTDTSGAVLCTLKGKWTGWDFTFASGSMELARVTKKWQGLGRELFTSADNYVLQIADTVPAESPIRMLILASVMSIDLVLKE